MQKRAICVLLVASLLVGVLFSAPLSVRAEGESLTANQTRMSAEGIALLKQYEGFSKYPYWDVSQWSVGYGTKCPGDKLELWKVTGISEAEAESLLFQFVNNFGAKLDAFISKYNLSLNQYQYDALMLFTYNCGAGWMNQEGLLRSAVINGATGNDFIYPFVLWCKADRVFSNGLIERRLAEANLYLNGVYGRRPPADYSFVRFDANGGEADYTVQGFDVDMPVPIKIIAEKTYTASNGAVYEFEGWYDSRVGGNKIETLDASRPYASYLYAHWKLIKEGTGSSDGNDPGGASTWVDVVVTATNLNARSGPGTNYDVVSSYKNGRQLTIIETKNGSGYLWGKIANTGNPGYWVALEHTNYFEVVQNQQPVTPPVTQPAPPPETQPPTTKPTTPPTTRPTTPPVTQPATQPTAPQGTLGTWQGVVRVSSSGSGLFVRSEPSTQAAKAGYLRHGTAVTIVERVTINGLEWGRMEKGWISLKYVSFEPDPTQPPETQTPTTAPTQPAPTQPETTVPETTEPSQPETIIPDYPNGDGSWNGVVDASYLPVRGAAGAVHAIVGYYKHGESVEITRCITVGSQLWGKVEEGWICLTLVSLDGEEVFTDDFMKVNTCSLRVRSGAGLGNTIVSFLSYGDMVAIHERQQVGSTLWGLTDFGWVDLKYLQ